MERTVNREMINQWIRENDPSGLFRLGQKSGVSPWTITRVKTGYVPKKSVTRRLLAKAMGTTEDDLFPLLQTVGKAS